MSKSQGAAIESPCTSLPALLNLYKFKIIYTLR